jgi:HSP20 family protein
MSTKKNSKNKHENKSLAVIKQPQDEFLDISFDKFPTLSKKLLSSALAVQQDKDNVYAQLNLPGLEEKDLKIDIKGKLVTISARKEKEIEEKSKNSYHYEKQLGNFSEAFTLGAKVDQKKIKIQHKGTTFKIIFPKK